MRLTRRKFLAATVAPALVPAAQDKPKKLVLDGVESRVTDEEITANWDDKGKKK